jgi:hypothetical protein
MGSPVELARGWGDIARLASLSHVLLTLDEVRAAGRRAFFVDWGESLLYDEGQLFDVREIATARQAGRRPAPLPAKVLEAGVGIEYGWRHTAGCDCCVCDVRRTTPQERAWRTSVVESGFAGEAAAASEAAVASEAAAPGLRASAARAAGSARRR